MSHIIEKKQRLFHSAIWKAQEEYYKKQAQQAWSAGETPDFISTNPFIAQYYARIVHAFFSDTQPTGHTYLLDIGAGSGRFAYYFLKAYQTLSPKHPFPFTYILCDFCESNLEAHLNNSQLQPFFNSGICDVAFLDAMQTINTLDLKYQKKRITSDDIESPLIAITNYLLASLPVDQLEIDQDAVRIAETTFSKNDADDYLKSSIAINYDRELSEKDIPVSTLFDRSLFPQTSFPYRIRFPSAAFQLLTNLRHFSKNQLVVLCSDLGSDNIDKANEPSPVVFARKKGNLWFPIDTFILSAWHSNCGGEHFFFEQAPSFFTVLLTNGINLTSLPKTQTCHTPLTWVTPLAVSQLFYSSCYSMVALLKAVELLECDFRLLRLKKDLIIRYIDESHYFKKQFSLLLLKHHEHIFVRDSFRSIANNILGHLFSHLDEHHLAIHYFERSNLSTDDPITYSRLKLAYVITETTSSLPDFEKNYSLSQCYQTINKVKRWFKQKKYKKPRTYLSTLLCMGLVVWFLFSKIL